MKENYEWVSIFVKLRAKLQMAPITFKIQIKYVKNYHLYLKCYISNQIFVVYFFHNIAYFNPFIINGEWKLLWKQTSKKTVDTNN